MSLLVDGNISTLADLQAYDSAVLEAARSEGIDLADKLDVATREVSLELKAFLLRHKSRVAVLNNGDPDLRTVVVTAGVKQWHALRTLAMVYADAQGSQLNDRYLRKQNRYEQQAKRAAETLLETGVGLVSDPIVRASGPEVQGAGTGPSAATYAVSVAWRNSRGEHGAASSPVTHKTGDGEGMTVRAIRPPVNAVSYDIYAGLSEEEMTQQNAGTIPSGEIWTMPATGLIQGAPPTDGQQPDYYVRHERILRRG